MHRHPLIHILAHCLDHLELVVMEIGGSGPRALIRVWYRGNERHKGQFLVTGSSQSCDRKVLGVTIDEVCR